MTLDAWSLTGVMPESLSRVVDEKSSLGGIREEMISPKTIHRGVYALSSGDLAAI